MGWKSNDMYNPIVYRMLPATNFGSERYINNEDFRIDSRKDDITYNSTKGNSISKPTSNVLNINVFPAKS